MIVNEEFVCPHCDTLISEGDFVYLRDDEVIGCEFCIDHEVVIVETEEDLEEEYFEALYENDRLTERLGL